MRSARRKMISAIRYLLSVAVFAVAVLTVGRCCSAGYYSGGYYISNPEVDGEWNQNFPTCADWDSWIGQYETFLHDKGTLCKVRGERVPVEVVEHDGYCVFIDREKKQAAAFVFHYTNHSRFISEETNIEISSAPKTVEITEKEKGFPVVKVYVDCLFADRTATNSRVRGENNPMALKIPRYVTDVEAVGDGQIEKLEVAKENPVLKVQDDMFLYKKVRYRREDTWALYRCIVRDKGEKAISIPSGTKVIMPYALMENKFGAKTKKIVLPDSVRRIGYLAFESLQIPVYVPKNAASIDRDAFINTDIYFPHGTKMKVLDLEIGNNNFDVPKGITRVKMLFTTRGYGKLTMSSTVKTIDSKAFHLNDFRSISLGKNVQSIGREAFKDCADLKKITLPKQLRSIGDRAFSGCVRLKKLTLPRRLRSIGKYAFLGTNILSLKVPASVKKLKTESFVRFDKRDDTCKYLVSNYYPLKKKPRMITLKVKKKSYAYRYAKKKGWKYKLG